jgi:phosphatidylglycerophosphate synthase
VRGLGQAWVLFAIAALALLLDGVDGWLARRRGEASAFGERFDMAADTAFTITVVACLVSIGHVGPWAILIGLVRPLFTMAGRLRPELAARLPASRRRKVACAAVLVLLVAGLAPVLAPAAPGLAALALLLLLASFGRDLLHLTGHLRWLEEGRMWGS